ncbi:hypothetical protein X975_19999, partial [Stegodyphus mimosarum]
LSTFWNSEDSYQNTTAGYRMSARAPIVSPQSSAARWRRFLLLCNL